MIDPTLEGDPADNPTDGAGPSILDVAGISDKTERHNKEAEQLQNEFELHAKSMQEIHKKIVSNRSASKALNNLAKNTTKNKKAKDRLSTQQRPHQPISGEVKKLIENEIFENNKTQIEVAKSFGVSDRQVQRIVDDARNDKPSASTNRRGAKSKLTADVITPILLLLKETPSTTLKKLAEHVKSEFDIQVTPAAIQKTLKTIEVTWKTVTPIPQKWNEAAFLQQRHNYVLNCVTNVGQKLIFVDESGFNSETRPLHGNAAALKTNVRGSMINLIGAMSEEGMPYYELLNKDGKKRLEQLHSTYDHCSTGSIIVMDNAKIHGGEDFERVRNLLKELDKKIEIEFLPKYSPFLNPIELAFNIIKINVKHKEIKSRSDLSKTIRKAISQKMTPKICHKSFLHCQKFYSSCTHMQPITGNIIKDPEKKFQVL
ncbi:hypothetical protein PtB15_6B80 [Puccinia triticina]|nr:hypothetical protein PtB15_6B80 [Puccinia triticina]